MTAPKRRDWAAVLRTTLPKEQRTPRPLPPTSTPAPALDIHAEDLLALNRRDYAQHVYDHLGGEHDHLWPLYLNPQLIQRTHAALLRKHRAVSRLTETGSGNAEARKRRRAFLDLLAMRIEQTEAAMPPGLLTSDLDTAYRLYSAIQIHRRATAREGIAPEPWDLALWEAADKLMSEGDGT